MSHELEGAAVNVQTYRLSPGVDVNYVIRASFSKMKYVHGIVSFKRICSGSGSFKTHIMRHAFTRLQF